MIKRIVHILLTLAVILATWETMATYSSFIAVLISRPSRTAAFMVANSLGLSYDLIHTLEIALIGLFGAILLGGGLGFYAALHPRFSSSVQAVATVMQAIPLIVFAPFLVIAFGVGILSKAVLAILMAMFPILLGFVNAAKQAEGAYHEFAAFYDLSPARAMTRVYLPMMFPSMVGHVRIASSLALLGAVIAEFTGSVRGLGRNIFLASIRVDPELLVSSLILTGLLGLSIHGVMTWAERKASWWNR